MCLYMSISIQHDWQVWTLFIPNYHVCIFLHPGHLLSLLEHNIGLLERKKAYWVDCNGYRIWCKCKKRYRIIVFSVCVPLGAASGGSLFLHVFACFLSGGFSVFYALMTSRYMIFF